MVKITFPDGSVREYNEGVTGLQIAESISSRLAQDVLACGVNGETVDLNRLRRFVRVQVSIDESLVSSLDIAEISARKPSCAAPSKAAIGPDGSEASSPAGSFSTDVSPAVFVVSKLAFAALMGSTLPSGFSSMAERT